MVTEGNLVEPLMSSNGILCSKDIRKERQLNIHYSVINTSNAELNPVCRLLALLAAHHILHLSRIRVNTESKKWGTGVDWLEFIL